MHRVLIAAMLLSRAFALLATPQHATRTQCKRRTQCESSASVDVADLKVSMDDLDKPLEELTVDTRGVDHTSRTGIQDDGCAWTERADSVEAVLRIPGLRGQPSGSLSVDVTPTSCTVSSFGMAVWSCLLKGKANPESVAVDISDGAEAIPTIELRVGKAEGSSGRWGGFIESIGEDSIL